MGNIILYGMKSCSGTIKLRKRLEGIDYKFRDIKRNPLSEQEIIELSKISENGLLDILSVKSARFKEMCIDHMDMRFNELVKLMANEPYLIRRPLLSNGTHLTVGTSNETKSFVNRLKEAEKRKNENWSARAGKAVV